MGKEMTSYAIVRNHFNGPSKVIKRGLTLEEARAHCKDPETSSRTCISPEACRYTEEHGQWFDGYMEEK